MAIVEATTLLTRNPLLAATAGRCLLAPSISGSTALMSRSRQTIIDMPQTHNSTWPVGYYEDANLFSLSATKGQALD